MEELIDELNKLSNYHYTKAEYDICEGIGKCVELLISNIEKEKEQIIDAFVECWKANMPDGYECKLSAKEYYNQTYNQNK